MKEKQAKKKARRLRLFFGHRSRFVTTVDMYEPTERRAPNGGDPYLAEIEMRFPSAS
jgi:hypothetical protein